MTRMRICDVPIGAVVHPDDQAPFRVEFNGYDDPGHIPGGWRTLKGVDVGTGEPARYFEAYDWHITVEA